MNVLVRGACASLVCLVALAAPARAHLSLLEPESRYGFSVLKEGPCGLTGGARSANVTTFEPGATITVRFDEYVDHPGHFRVAFDADGDDGFQDPVCLAHCDTRTDPAPPEFADETGVGGVLLDKIADSHGGETAIQVTLPDVECDNCTLQVIQVMYDKRPYTSPGNDVYFQCADLVLKRAAPADEAVAEPVTEPGVEPGAEVDTAEPAPDAAVETSPGDDLADVADSAESDSGGTPIGAGADSSGCAGGGGGGASLGLGLVLAALASRAVRRARG